MKCRIPMVCVIKAWISLQAKKIISIFLLIGTMSAGSLFATSYYWDSNGTTAGAGATPNGTWGSDAYWNTNASGLGVLPFVSTLTTNDDTTFCAGTDATNAYTVTVSGTQSAKSMTFQEGTPTLTGGTIVLAGGATVSSGASQQGTVTIGSALQVLGAAAATLNFTANNGAADTDLLITGTVSSATVNTYQLRLLGAGKGRLTGSILNDGNTFLASAGTWSIGGNQALASTMRVLDTASLTMGDSTADVQSWGTTLIYNAATPVLTVNATATGTSVTIRGGGGTMNVVGSYTGTGFAFGQSGTNDASQHGVLKLSGGQASFSGDGSAFTVYGTGSKIIGGASSTGMLVISISSTKTLGSELTLGGGGANENNFRLVKGGTSILTLSNANTYVGGTIISNGTLAVQMAGSIGGGDLTVCSGATFVMTNVAEATFALGSGANVGGEGTVLATGKTLSSGGVSPGGAPGTLTVQGGLTLDGSGISTFQINGTNSALFDKLVVTNGTLTCGGTLSLVTGYTPAVGDKVKLLQCSAPISGTFSTITGAKLGYGSWDASQLSNTGEITFIAAKGTVVQIR